ncbi:hypothetical protein [Mycobacterium paraterrae]|uniref:Uncharacterized protein n=1 Tax=Mycobacterium paraterrae TaxID=577492 RepID=A0ABY3VSC6_9MYCO|nr:hypothetical protein [Mycobacterium paraterrae]UMB70098.1 hypothetical protein MKK62_01745 [Mycobacterium paraterrae]
MPAESIKICPPELLASADASAKILDEAAAPTVGGTPGLSKGVAASDVAGAAVAAGIGLLEQGFSAAAAPVGEDVESTTQVGVARLESQDEANADELRDLGEQGPRQWR